MARNIEFDVTTVAKGRGLTDSARDLDGLADRTDKAATRFNGLARESGNVDRQLRITRDTVRSIGVEIDRTGNKSLFKDLGKAERELKQLERLAKRITPGGGGPGAGGLATAGAFGANLRGAMIPALIGGVIAASPIIGAAVGAAVAGAAATGGVIGGIVLASRDTRVKSAWADMGTDLMDQLGQDSAVFVAPLVDGANDIGQAFRDANPAIESMFKKLSSAMPALTSGAGGFVKEFASAMDMLADVGGPILEELGAELPNIGHAIADMAGSIRNAGPEIREFWSDFLDGTKNTIVGLGNTVEFLSKVYSATKEGINIAAGLANVASGQKFDPNVVKGLGEMNARALASRAATELMVKTDKDLADAAKLAADAINAQNQAFHDLLNTELGALNANLSYEQSMDDLTKAVDDNGRSLNIHSQKGRDNERAILNVVSALAQQRDAEVAAGASVDVANAHFQGQIGTLRGHLIQLGFNRGAVDRLVASINKVPPKTDTFVRISGVSPANSAIDSVRNKLANLDGRTATVFIRSVTTTAGAGGFQPMAEGTDYAPGGMAWVGERGPELVYMPRGAQVFPHGESMAMANSSSGGGNVGTLTVVHTTPSGEVLWTELLALKRQTGKSTLGL